MGSSIVLVAEDHSDTRELFSLILKSEGFEVRQAADGEEALEILSRSRPDVLLLDLMMPKLSGLQLIQRVRATPGLTGLPIVAVSAYWGGPLRLASLYGADLVMYKPFEPGKVVEAVRFVLQNIASQGNESFNREAPAEMKPGKRRAPESTGKKSS